MTVEIVTSYPASAEAVAIIAMAEVGTGEGRSEWRWFWTSAGDLILGCYPRGDTFFGTEVIRERDLKAVSS